MAAPTASSSQDIEKMIELHPGTETAVEKSRPPHADSDHDSDTESHSAAGSLDIERASRNRQSDDLEPEGRASRVSETLRRTTSNALASVASRITTRTWAEPPPPPDGGLMAWKQVACGWLIVFTTWGLTNSFGSFQAYYTATMPYSPSSISWIGSVQIFLTLTTGIFSGRLLDAGFFLPTLFVGAVIQVLGMFLMSISTQYWQLMLTQGVMTGLGSGIFFTPSMALITTYFSTHRGVAVGIVTTGNSVGGMIYPVIVRELIPRLGFAWTARVLAFVNLTALTAACAFMRPRLPPRKSGSLIDATAFKDPIYMLLALAFCCFTWSNFYTFTYIASFARETLGLDYAGAVMVVIILNGSGLPFRVIIPFIGDNVGPTNVLMPVVAVWTITSFAWLAVVNMTGYYIFAVFYGICSGAFQCLTAVVMTSTTKRLDMAGTRLGMAFCMTSFFALTGPPLGGAILGASDGVYYNSHVFAAISMLVGAIAALWARMLKSEWKFMARC